ncbi:MAG: GGDEF domain-containing protein [Solobacterium sp.]|nr:GGDEF domain-containing protein [Solobacterium sp.]
MLKEMYNHIKDTQIFKKYRDKVTEYNADALGYFLTLGIVTCIGALLLELFLLKTRDYWAVVGLTVYFCVCHYYFHKNIEEKVDYATLYLYLIQIPVFLLTIFLGTMVNPDEKAFTFMVALLSFPLFILDKPRNLFIYIVAMTVMFIGADMYFKSGELLRHDILHCLVTCVISIATTFFVMTNRIENVENSLSFKTDSEHDPLTGIYNRRGGEEKIKGFIAEKIPGTFLILDIDDFKHVNDTYGHTMGDEVLAAVSMTLASSFRSTDVVMRMGGDEFVVYAPGLVNYFFINSKLEQIVSRMREITCSQGRDNITVSIGSVINDGTYPTYEDLFNEGDRMLYEMKNNGKNGFRLQDRTFNEVKGKMGNAEDVAAVRAMREAASAEEEKKHKK